VPILAAGLALGLALPAAGGTDPSQQAQALRARRSALAGRSHGALLSLYSLDARLARARSELDALRSRLTVLGAQEQEIAREQAVARAAWHSSVLTLGAHLRALYEQGTPDTLGVLLGATSVNDALSRLDDLQRSAALSRQTLDEARASATTLAAAQHRLASATAQAETLAATAAATASSLERVRADRVGYIASLARQRTLNARQLRHLEQLARASAARSQTIAPPPQPTLVSTPVAPGQPPVPAGNQLVVTATGYSMGGHTATGLPVGWGVVAVDPSVIPLGTRLTIPGYGEGIAADTGGAVRGAVIDLWFPTVAEAMAWGRRTVTITLH
jgi:3D (Asp-Asp-Asp) domain-containing protein